MIRVIARILSAVEPRYNYGLPSTRAYRNGCLAGWNEIKTSPESRVGYRESKGRGTLDYGLNAHDSIAGRQSDG